RLSETRRDEQAQFSITEMLDRVRQVFRQNVPPLLRPSLPAQMRLRTTEPSRTDRVLRAERDRGPWLGIMPPTKSAINFPADGTLINDTVTADELVLMMLQSDLVVPAGDQPLTSWMRSTSWCRDGSASAVRPR